MNEAITITLPLPGRILSPNYRSASTGGVIGRAVAVKRYKLATAAAVEAQRLETIPWDGATIAIVYYHPVRRRRDADNALASLKPAIDGLVLAGLVRDDAADQLAIGDIEFRTGSPARVELTITKWSEEE